MADHRDRRVSGMSARGARRAGWSLLLVWALVGAGLEAAHAFKWTEVLDAPLLRLLLRLAHAHGVGLALLLLVHAMQDDARGRRPLLAGAVLMPLGFLLGCVAPYESDPGVGIALAPIGAACVLYGLGRSAWAAWATEA